MHDADPSAGVLERLRPRLEAMAIGRGVRAADVDDVVQDTLVAALEKLAAHRFHNESSMATWVHAILIHKIFDYFRDKQRTARRLVAIDERGDAVSAGTLDDLACTPDYETQLLVVWVLTELPPRERMVLLLNRQDGHTTREIAPLLGVGQKVAEKLLTAAKKRFVQLVGAAEESGGETRLTKKGIR